eukprot:365744-Chlamydomonas_euryale.AAC.23
MAGISGAAGGGSRPRRACLFAVVGLRGIRHCIAGRLGPAKVAACPGSGSRVPIQKWQSPR